MKYLPLWQLKIVSHSPVLVKHARNTLYFRVRAYILSWGLPFPETLVMMRRRNTVISRALALAVTNPADWTPDIMEFYCPYREFDAVCLWFSNVGYAVVDQKVPTTYPENLGRDDMAFSPGNEWMYWDMPHTRYNINDGVHSTTTFLHIEKNTQIRVFQSYSDCPIMPICLLPSTLWMNYIAGNGVVCLYPQFTNRDRGTLTHSNLLRTANRTDPRHAQHAA